MEFFFTDKSNFFFFWLLKQGHIWSNTAARINFIVISNKYIKIYKFLFKNLAIKKKYLPVALLISNFWPENKQSILFGPNNRYLWQHPTQWLCCPWSLTPISCHLTTNTSRISQLSGLCNEWERDNPIINLTQKLKFWLAMIIFPECTFTKENKYSQISGAQRSRSFVLFLN